MTILSRIRKIKELRHAVLRAKRQHRPVAATYRELRILVTKQIKSEIRMDKKVLGQ